MKNDSYGKGRKAEDKAAKWIEKNKGYAVIDRNYRSPSGEIDIIAKDGETVVFIEVKFRKGTSHGYPAEAVTRIKQERIIKTAMCYIQENGGEDIRFDVAELIDYKGITYIRYIENAFEWRQCQ